MNLFKKLFGSKPRQQNQPETPEPKNQPETDFDINVPVTNPEVVRSINAFYGEQTEPNLINVIDSLLKAKFLVLTYNDEMHVDSPGETTVIKQNSRIKFLNFYDNQENALLPLFTDWDRAYKWLAGDNENVGGFVMSTFEAFEFANLDGSYKGIIINPNSEQWAMDKEQIGNFLSDFKQ